MSDLWDAALTSLLDEAKKVLPAADMEKLTAKQNAWLEPKTKAVEAVGRDVNGCSIYAQIVNRKAANLTEERVYEVLERLK